MSTVELTSENWDSVVGRSSLVLVDFWAPWCGPCRAFGPTFDRASEQHPDILFGKVNIDQQKPLADRFGVRGIPTLKVISNGAVRGSKTGAMPAFELEQLITQFRQDNHGTGPEGGAQAPARDDEVPDTDGSPADPWHGGLVASFAMVEGDGHAAADQINGHLLTLRNTRWGPGYSGPGLVFNGFSSATTKASLVNTNEDFSVSAWVRLTDADDRRIVISQDGSSVSGFYLQYSSGHDAWTFVRPSHDSPQASPIRAVALQPARIGYWQHLAGVYDAWAGQLRLYVDGRRAGTKPFRGGWHAAGPFVVGRGLFDGPVGWFVGSVDLVRAWNRALSDAEVAGVAAALADTDGTVPASGRGSTAPLRGSQ